MNVLDAKIRHARYYEEVLRRANDFYIKGGDALKKGLELFDFEWSNIQARQN